MIMTLVTVTVDMFRLKMGAPLIGTMNIRLVIVTIDMFRLKMRSVTAVEVAKATRSPNGVNVELCHYLLNLKRGSMSMKTKSLQNLVKSNQLNFIPRSQNTIMLAHHLLFLLSLHADEVHTHFSADVPRVQPTCLE